MKNLVSIFGGHDANITFYNADKDEYHLIELERLVKKRYLIHQMLLQLQDIIRLMQLQHIIFHHLIKH